RARRASANLMQGGRLPEWSCMDRKGRSAGVGERSCDMTAYDYVIIGAGTAGCVLANRLSADPKVSVCVLEAGPGDRLELIHTPGALGAFFFTKKYDWCFEAKPDLSIRKGQPLFCARGKTLGGSSSINGMVYSRGHPSDYDHWAELGNPGWSFEELL